MKKYCFDTSGLMKPQEDLPEDLHVSVWQQVRQFLQSGQVAVTFEIYKEMLTIGGELGNCIHQHRDELLLDVYDSSWPWEDYIQISNDLLTRYREFISEYNNNVRQTVSVVDISIIAQAIALDIPVVSSERPVLMPGNESKTKRRIPDICRLESVTHHTFNEFLRLENIHG